MIVKFYELKKNRDKKKSIYLLYGNNKGLIEETIDESLKPIFPKNVINYDEAEILNNVNLFYENLLTKSFFENEKLIIINRSSDKILKIIEEIISKQIDDFKIILKASSLDKKSKLRNFFEKNEDIVIVPFYEDNNQTLYSIAQKFFRDKKINISSQNLNLIIERARGDRLNLRNELKKIENYTANGKKISNKEILEITNLAENYNISELVDNCLATNKNKTLNIINENNNEISDNIMIIRTFLSKLSRLRKIQIELRNNEKTDEVLDSFKPKIFWKEKDIIKQQLKYWPLERIQNHLNNINDTELLVKKNPQISNYITQNFILEKFDKN